MALNGRAKIFLQGGSQAIRVPRAFRLSGTEAEISRTATGGIRLDPLEEGIEARRRRFTVLAGPNSNLLHTMPAPRLRAAPPRAIYLPDATTTLAFLSGRNPPLAIRMTQAFDQLCRSAIVLAECEFLASRATDVSSRVKLRELSELVSVLPFTTKDCAHYGAIRCQLAASGKTCEPAVVQLAAQSLRLGATIVTDQIEEYLAIPETIAESWSTPVGS